MKLFFLKKYEYGTKFIILNKEFFFVNKKFSNYHKKIQAKYDLSICNNANTVIIFLIPPEPMITGGILSIFSICKHTRTILKDVCSVIVTFPGNLSYSSNNYFINDEKIYNWNQIMGVISSKQNVLIHIPEYLSSKFYYNLSEEQKNKLKNCNRLHINILNQNIKLMPNKNEISSLYFLTSQVTQTISHDRVMTSLEYLNWGLPTYFLSVYIDILDFKKFSFFDKEKIIAYSLDKNKYKLKILNKIKKELNDFKLIEIKKIKFEEYTELISKAYFTISFGEGFDSYFCQPYLLGGIGFSVYNDDFFPEKNWLKYCTVFKDYYDMEERIVFIIKYLLESEDNYNNVVNNINMKLSELYSKQKLLDNLKEFYIKTNYTLQ